MSDLEKDKKPPLTASTLRENVYKILDEIILSGEGVEIYRKGSILRIEPPLKKAKGRRLDQLPKRDLIVGDPDDLIHLDWLAEWRS
jgi:hypothetical protein